MPRPLLIASGTMASAFAATTLLIGLGVAAGITILIGVVWAVLSDPWYF